MHATIVFGMWAIIPYWLPLWYFIGFLRQALGEAVTCRGLSGWLLILLWSRVH